jgi:hypothetical protein
LKAYWVVDLPWRICKRAAFALAILFIPSGFVAAQTTALYFDSQPGESIGQGLQQTWTPSATTRFGVWNNGQSTVHVHVDGVGFYRRADILWQHRTRGSIAVWLMWDNTVLDTRMIASVDRSWRVAGVGRHPLDYAERGRRSALDDRRRPLRGNSGSATGSRVAPGGRRVLRRAVMR